MPCICETVKELLTKETKIINTKQFDVLQEAY